MKVVAIIQARMGSTRLPGKVMKEIVGKTVLEHVITRVKQAKGIDEIVIATTIKPEDEIIAIEAERLGVKVFRGSEEDVLSRYYHAAKENNSDVIIRITSDCPLIDPEIIDKLIGFYIDNDYRIVTNAGSDLSKRTYPRGLDTEIFSLEELESAFMKAKNRYQREHVTPYMYENDNIFNYKNDKDYSKHRWTLDTKEDFELITRIYSELYNEKHDFYLDDIIKLFEKRPELFNINAHVEQKTL